MVQKASNRSAPTGARTKDKPFKKRLVLYVDMDNVLVDFPTGIAALDTDTRQRYEAKWRGGKPHYDDIPGIFEKMRPLKGAIAAYKKLSKLFNTYILSTSPWHNPSAWSDKLVWVQKHLGRAAYKRLILSHHKHLNRGDFLIDDRRKNGVWRFSGEHIHFGAKGDPRFADWRAVVKYLTAKLKAQKHVPK